MEQPYHCKLCGVGVQTKTLFKAHMASDKHKVNALKGLRWTRQWMSWSQRKGQMQSFKCATCNLTFKSGDELSSHLKSLKHAHKQAQQGRASITLCPLCGFHTETAEKLINHLSSLNFAQLHIRKLNDIKKKYQLELTAKAKKEKAAKIEMALKQNKVQSKPQPAPKRFMQGFHPWGFR